MKHSVESIHTPYHHSYGDIFHWLNVKPWITTFKCMKAPIYDCTGMAVPIKWNAGLYGYKVYTARLINSYCCINCKTLIFPSLMEDFDYPGFISRYITETHL